MRPVVTHELAQRLFENVTINDNGCWLWAGRIDNLGYGVIDLPATADDPRRIKGASRARPYRVHRLVMQHVTDVPDGHLVHHACPGQPNKTCLNPAHLEVKSAAEHVREHHLGTHHVDECHRGHPYTEANSWFEGPTGRRRCRTCMKDNARRARAKAKAAAAPNTDCPKENP